MKLGLKKVISLVLVAALSVPCFVGCGNAEDKDEQGRTIIYPGNYPTDEGTDRDNYDKRVEEFMAANSDVNIKPSEYAWELQTFYSKGAAGQLPTDFGIFLTEFSGGVQAGYLADITDAMTKHNLNGYVNPILESIIKVDGKYYGVPETAYVLGITYSVELFKKAGLVNEDGTPKRPRTWDELAEFAGVIKQKTGKAGLVMPTINNTGGWLFTPIAWSYGVEFMKQDKDGKWKATFNTPEMVEALQWMKDLKWKYDALQTDLLIDNGPARQELIVSNAGMLISGPSILEKNITYGVDANTLGCFAMPAGPKRHVTLLGGSARAISSKSTKDQVDAGIRWIKTKLNPKLTEDVKKNLDRTYAEKAEQGVAIGYYGLTPWNTEAEAVKYENELIEKYRNVDTVNFESYNEFILTGKFEGKTIEVQPEEPRCAQELYRILDKIIQEVLTNKDADCKKLVKEACGDFQRDYLDFI